MVIAKTKINTYKPIFLHNYKQETFRNILKVIRNNQKQNIEDFIFFYFMSKF